MIYTQHMTSYLYNLVDRSWQISSLQPSLSLGRAAQAIPLPLSRLVSLWNKRIKISGEYPSNADPPTHEWNAGLTGLSDASCPACEPDNFPKGDKHVKMNTTTHTHVHTVIIGQSSHLIVVKRETQFTLIWAQVVFHKVRIFIDVYGLEGELPQTLASVPVALGRGRDATAARFPSSSVLEIHDDRSSQRHSWSHITQKHIWLLY